MWPRSCPEAELAGEMGDQHVGLQARMMSQALRKLTAKCAGNHVSIIWINQIREDWSDVWQSRDNDRWTCTEILLQPTYRCTPQGGHQ